MNPMDLARFDKGIETLEIALQGKFDGRFTTYLANAIKHCSQQEWEECVERLAKGLKKPSDLVVGDFLQVLREIRDEKAATDNHWEFRPPGNGSPNWKGMAEKICADPMANDTSKSIARELAARKDVPPPPMVGGEKYRRQKKS